VPTSLKVEILDFASKAFGSQGISDLRSEVENSVYAES